MMTLDSWLKQATRKLSTDSAAQVRTEIQQHYDAWREASAGNGASDEEADRLALAALGDAGLCNRQYRKTLLTSAEAGMLRDANWEARVVCSHFGLRRAMLAAPVVTLLAAVTLFVKGMTEPAQILLAGSLVLGVVLAGPFLPVYTVPRARAFRAVKWVVLSCMFAFAFGPAAMKSMWLLSSCVWPLLWIEWKRVAIRRKLPVARWPRQLYL